MDNLDFHVPQTNHYTALFGGLNYYINIISYHIELWLIPLFVLEEY